MKNNIDNPAEYADLSVIAHEASEAMIARLEVVALKPRYILDVGCGAGVGTRLLKNCYPNAEIVAVDQDVLMLKYAISQQTQKDNSCFFHWLCAEPMELPIAENKIDLIVANLVLPWCQNIKKLFQEWLRILRPGGLLVFTSLGLDTLTEWDRDKILPHLVDMHNLGDELLYAGFADPVMDVEHFSMKYQNDKQLLHELQVTQMISSQSVLQSAIPRSLTYEVIYGHGWKPEMKTGYSADETGVVKIPLSHLKN